ncbi:hypothetical protein AB0A98_06345 [Streptomyces chrestomyceticus]|uniref:hypothetical protein n=1 Tax=Streptomyces chrestomyceticus TaxID=68185 RepID=UPI0033F5416F
MSSSWRNIPIPDCVARLPCNSAGRPVPANVTWREPDDDGSIPVDRDPELGAHVTCPCTPGRGKPWFGEQCPVRQRQFMLQRQCGLCTEPIAPSAQLMFIGETNAPYYLEPPLHQACAAYALQVCPVLHVSGERIEVALTASYTLGEDRITGVAADGALRRSVFPLGFPPAYHLAVLEFYLAFPATPERHAAPTWLAQYAPKQLPAPTD